ncbi:MAG: hypothetical protein OXB95_14515, partial [Rhodobacteraceae bacterium]|nr:hypothetical protein [Paracoccaceae bacterium]
LAKEGFALVVSIPSIREADNVFPTVLLDDTRGDSDEAKRDWLLSLHAMNLLQFSPQFQIVPKSNPNAIDHPGEVVRPNGDMSEWDELTDLADDDFQKVFRYLRTTRVELPEVGYDISFEGSVIGDAELAWPDRKLAVVANEQLEALKHVDWTLLDCASVIAKPSTLLRELGFEVSIGDLQ